MSIAQVVDVDEEYDGDQLIRRPQDHLNYAVQHDTVTAPGVPPVVDGDLPLEMRAAAYLACNVSKTTTNGLLVSRGGRCTMLTHQTLATLSSLDRAIDVIRSHRRESAEDFMEVATTRIMISSAHNAVSLALTEMIGAPHVLLAYPKARPIRDADGVPTGGQYDSFKLWPVNCASTLITELQQKVSLRVSASSVARLERLLDPNVEDQHSQYNQVLGRVATDQIVTNLPAITTHGSSPYQHSLCTNMVISTLSGCTALSPRGEHWVDFQVVAQPLSARFRALCTVAFRYYSIIVAVVRDVASGHVVSWVIAEFEGIAADSVCPTLPSKFATFLRGDRRGELYDGVQLYMALYPRLNESAWPLFGYVVYPLHSYDSMSKRMVDIMLSGKDPTENGGVAAVSRWQVVSDPVLAEKDSFGRLFADYINVGDVNGADSVVSGVLRLYISVYRSEIEGWAASNGPLIDLITSYLPAVDVPTLSVDQCLVPRILDSSQQSAHLAHCESADAARREHTLVCICYFEFADCAKLWCCVLLSQVYPVVLQFCYHYAHLIVVGDFLSSIEKVKAATSITSFNWSTAEARRLMRETNFQRHLTVRLLTSGTPGAVGTRHAIHSNQNAISAVYIPGHGDENDRIFTECADPGSQDRVYGELQQSMGMYRGAPYIALSPLASNFHLYKHSEYVDYIQFHLALAAMYTVCMVSAGSAHYKVDDRYRNPIDFRAIFGIAADADSRNRQLTTTVVRDCRDYLHALGARTLRRRGDEATIAWHSVATLGQEVAAQIALAQVTDDEDTVIELERRLLTVLLAVLQRSPGAAVIVRPCEDCTFRVFPGIDGQGCVSCRGSAVNTDPAINHNELLFGLRSALTVRQVQCRVVQDCRAYLGATVGSDHEFAVYVCVDEVGPVQTASGHCTVHIALPESTVLALVLKQHGRLEVGVETVTVHTLSYELSGFEPRIHVVLEYLLNAVQLVTQMAPRTDYRNVFSYCQHANITALQQWLYDCGDVAPHRASSEDTPRLTAWTPLEYAVFVGAQIDGHFHDQLLTTQVDQVMEVMGCSMPRLPWLRSVTDEGSWHWVSSTLTEVFGEQFERLLSTLNVLTVSVHGTKHRNPTMDYWTISSQIDAAHQHFGYAARDVILCHHYGEIGRQEPPVRDHSLENAVAVPILGSGARGRRGKQPVVTQKPQTFGLRLISNRGAQINSVLQTHLNWIVRPLYGLHTIQRDLTTDCCWVVRLFRKMYVELGCLSVIRGRDTLPFGPPFEHAIVCREHRGLTFNGNLSASFRSTKASYFAGYLDPVGFGQREEAVSGGPRDGGYQTPPRKSPYVSQRVIPPNSNGSSVQILGAHYVGSDDPMPGANDIRSMSRAENVGDQLHGQRWMGQEVDLLELSLD